jgi:hypothetical protein
VVAGAAMTIARDRPSVIFEYAPELLTSQSQSPFGWFADQGYELYRVRWARNRLTGRGPVVLDHLAELPEVGGDILAVAPARVPAITHLVA